jgi:signal peptidase II
VNWNRHLHISLIAALVLLLDQSSKFWVQKTIPLHTEIPVIRGFFSLVHVRNRGAAFGFLNRHDIEWQFWLFLAATLLAALVIIILARQAGAGERLFFSALGLILGGAAGNLVDRVMHRAVVDFLDFYIGHRHWPAFNVADIAICCGAGLALLLSWKRPGAEKRNAEKA